MSEQGALARLIDRQAVVDVVVQYATGLDRRDWALYAACFTDPCELDFSGWRGQAAVVLTPAEWAAKVRATNGNFDTTSTTPQCKTVTSLNGAQVADPRCFAADTTLPETENARVASLRSGSAAKSRVSAR
jgi:hypothetical protein